MQEMSEGRSVSRQRRRGHSYGKKWLIVSCVLLACLAAWSQAAESKPAGVLSGEDQPLRTAETLMRQENWRAAMPLIDTALRAGAVDLSFKGTLLYQKGRCLQELASDVRGAEGADDGVSGPQDEAEVLWNKAIECYQACSELESTAEVKNHFQYKAVQRKAQCQQALKQYQTAIATYEEFLHLRHDIRDIYDASLLQSNLAICYWQLGQHAQAQEHLKLAMNYPQRNTRALYKAMISCAEDCVRRGDEQQWVSLFLQYRQQLAIPEDVLVSVLPQLDRLLVVLYRARFSQALTQAYRMIPELAEIDRVPINELLAEAVRRSNIHFPTGNKAVALPAFGGLYTGDELMEKVYARRGTLEALQHTQELALRLQAAQAQALGAKRVALAAYGQWLNDGRLGVLEEWQENAEVKSEIQRVILLASIWLGAEMGEHALAAQWAEAFLKNYQDDEQAAVVKGLQVELLFESGDYEQCEALLRGLLAVEEKAEKRSAYQLKLAACAYYSGDYARALDLLEAHGQAFPNSKDAEQRVFMQAGSAFYLHRLAEAREGYEQLLADAQTSAAYRAQAAYYLAYCDYLEEQPEAALTRLAALLLEKQPNQKLVAEVQLLAGNVLASQQEMGQAKERYVLALTAARAAADPLLEDECTYSLIALLGRRTVHGLLNEEMTEAVGHFDDFVARQRQTSPYYLQVLASAVPSLEYVERGDEALRLLEEGLFEKLPRANTAGVEAALDLWMQLKKRQLGTEAKLREHLAQRFSDKTPADSRAEALKNYGILASLKREAFYKKTPELQQTIIAQLASLLKLPWQAVDHFMLLEIAELLPDQEKVLQQKIYRRVASSDSPLGREEAELALARGMVASSEEDEVAEAFQRLEQIRGMATIDATTRADAHFYQLSYWRKKEDWQSLEREALAYLENNAEHKNYQSEALLALAQAYDAQQKIELAIPTYHRVVIRSMQDLRVSVSAATRLVELLWERNHPAVKGVQGGKSDRQLAYETAYKYIYRTQKVYEAKKNENNGRIGKDIFKKWLTLRAVVREWHTSPEVKRFNKAL